MTVTYPAGTKAGVYNGSFGDSPTTVTIDGTTYDVTYTPGTLTINPQVIYKPNTTTPEQADVTVDVTYGQSHTVRENTTFTNETGGIVYRFTGWNTEADGTGTAYAPNAPLTFEDGQSQVVLYAQWTDVVATVNAKVSIDDGNFDIALFDESIVEVHDIGSSGILDATLFVTDKQAVMDAVVGYVQGHADVIYVNNSDQGQTGDILKGAWRWDTTMNAVGDWTNGNTVEAHDKESTAFDAKTYQFVGYTDTTGNIEMGIKFYTLTYMVPTLAANINNYAGEGAYQKQTSYLAELGHDMSGTVTTENGKVREFPGYTFAGWVDASGDPVTIGNLTGKTVVYAKYTPNTDTAYTVQHYQQNVADDGYTLADTDNLTGTTDAAAAYTPKTYTGFAYQPDETTWQYGENGELSTTALTIAADGSLIIKLYYDRNSYDVTYMMEGETDPAHTDNYTYGAAVTEWTYDGTIPEGYHFDGWYTTSGYTTKWTAPATMPAEDITVYGRILPNTNTQFTVKYWFEKVDSEDYEQNLTGYPDLTQTGTTGATVNASDYVLTTVPEGFVLADDTDTATIAGDDTTVLNVYYDRVEYTLTIIYTGPNDGVFVAPETHTGTLKYGASYSVNSPAVTGYTPDQSVVSGTMPAEDRTVEVVYTANTGTAYTVQHYQQNVTGSGYDLAGTENLTGTTAAEAAFSQKDYPGFTYQSDKTTWQYGQSGTPSSTALDIAADGSLIIKLYYDRNTWTVSYDLAGGNIDGAATVADEDYRYGATVTVKDDPVRAGYTFTRWSVDPEVIIANGQFTMPDNAVKLTAQWTANADTEYTVKHHLQNLDGDDYALEETETLYGTTGERTQAQAKTYTGFTAQAFEQKTIAGDGSTVVDIYYDRNSYAYNYQSVLFASGRVIENGQSQNAVFGSEVTIKAPSYEGYVLVDDTGAVVENPDKYAQELIIGTTGNVATFYYKIPAMVTAGNAEKTYDGAPLTNKTDGYTFGNPATVESAGADDSIESIDFTDASTITDFGTQDNEISSVIISDGTDDVTGDYILTYVDGTLTINKRAVTLTSATDSKPYDGTPLTNSTVTVTGDGFVAGEGATYDVIGSQTLVGESENTFTYELNEGTKAINYNILMVPGTLTVTDDGDNPVVKSHKGADYGLGDTVTFTIEVTNIYDEAKNITVTEQDGVTITGTNPEVTISGQTATFENVAAGTTVTVTATYTITEADILEGSYTNNVDVTIGGKDFDGDDTVTLEDPEAGLTVTKTADQTEGLNRGDTVTYTIKVENTGNVTVNDIAVTDPKATIAEGAGKIETLAPGEYAEVKATYTITEADILEGKFVNTATATGTAADGNDSEVTGSDTETVYTVAMNGQLNIAKAITNIGSGENGAFRAGDVIEYKITVTNVGNVTVTDIDISDSLVELDAVEGYAPFDLTPGASKELTYSYTVQATDVGQTVVNEAIMDEGTMPTPNPDNSRTPDPTTTPSATATAPVPAAKAITITADSTSKPYDGTALTDNGYTYDETALTEGDYISSVTVTGSQTFAGESRNVPSSAVILRGQGEDAVDVTANYDITYVNGTLEVTPRDVTIVAASDSKVYDGTELANGSYAVLDGDYTAEGAELPEDIAFTGNGSAVVNGELITATVTGGQTLVGSSDNVPSDAKVDGVDSDNYTFHYIKGTLTVTDDDVDDGLVVDKSHKGSGFDLGDKVTCTITAKNIYAVEKDITITEQTAGVTITAAAGGTIAGDGMSATFENVAAGATVTVTAEYTITEADINAYGFTNEVIATIENIGYSDSDTVDLAGADPKLAVTKTETGDDAGWVKEPGDLVTYTIEVENTGNLTISNVTVSDPQATIVAGNGYTVENGIAKVDGAMAPGDTVTVNAQYTFTETDMVAGEFVNTATAAGTASNGNNVSASDDVKVYADMMNGQLSITKAITNSGTGEDGKFRAGDVINYKITVTNEGNITVTNIRVADLLDNGKTIDLGNSGIIASLAPGGSASIECQYTVTEDDLGKTLTNAASIAGGTTPDGGVSPLPTDWPTATVPTDVQPKKTITITADSTSKTYDGTTLTDDGYIMTGDLTGDDKLDSVTVTGSQTAAGESDNVPSDAKIVDANGNDVTANYYINYVNGELEVTKRDVTIVADSDSKAYDSTALTNGNYAVLDGNVTEIPEGITFSTDGVGILGNGETITATVTGSQTLVGSSDNVPGNALVNGATSNNYEYHYINGTLTVTDDGDNPVVKSHNGAEYGLGETVTFTIEVTNIYDEVKNITITEQAGVTITGESYFEGVQPGAQVSTTATYTITEADILAGSFKNTATAAFEGGKTFEDDDEVETDPISPALTVVKVDATEPSKEAYELNDVVNYEITVTNTGNVTIEGISVEDATGAIVEGEGYTVEEGVAKVDALEPGEAVVVKATHSITEEDVITGSYKNVAVARGTAPDPEDPEKDVPVEEEGEEEVPVEPMDGTLSVTKTIENMGEGSGEDGAFRAGDVIEYKITVTNTGNVTVSGAEVRDELNGVEYDVPADVALGDMKPGDVKEITYSYTVQASDVGTTVVNVAIVDGGTTPTPDPENPNPSPDPTPTPSASATVPVAEAQEITIEAASTSKIYDGTPLELDEITDSYKDGLLDADADAVVTATVTGSQTDVGESDNVPSDASIVVGETDRTANYEPTYVNGTLTVYPRGVDPEDPEKTPDPIDPDNPPEDPESWRVILKANDNLGITYDGEVHGANGYTIMGVGLVEGHYVDEEALRYIGGQQDVKDYSDVTPDADGNFPEGTFVYENELRIDPASVIIRDAAGNDVTGNYYISYLPGDLEIRPIEVHIQVPDVTMYSGEEIARHLADAIVAQDSLSLLNGDRLDYDSVKVVYENEGLNGIIEGDGSRAIYPDYEYSGQTVGVNQVGRLYVRDTVDAVTNEDILSIDLSALRIIREDGSDVTSNYHPIIIDGYGDLTVRTITLTIRYRLYDNGRTTRQIMSDGYIPYLSVGDTFTKWCTDIAGYIILNQYTYEPASSGHRTCDPIVAPYDGENYLTLYYGLPRTSYTINYIYLDDPTLNTSEVVSGVAVGTVVSDIGGRIISHTVEGYTHLRTEGLTLIVEAGGVSEINVYYSRTGLTEIIDLGVPTGASLGALNVGDCCE